MTVLNDLNRREAIKVMADIGKADGVASRHAGVGIADTGSIAHTRQGASQVYHEARST
jgi:hypothetical protein